MGTEQIPLNSISPSNIHNLQTPILTNLSKAVSFNTIHALLTFKFSELGLKAIEAVITTVDKRNAAPESMLR